MNYIVLDTNIFIHFRDFDQINWSELVGNNQDYIILIPPTVIDELDRHKYNKNQKISKRAKRILPKIEDYTNTPDDSLQLKLLNSRPKDETFNANQLNRGDQDDCILASIIEFRQSITENDNLIYFTYDTGPRLKAKTLSINCMKISEQYLLPHEPDENEIKNKELLKELNTFKNKAPKVVLEFVESNDLLKPEQKKPIKSKDEFVKHFIDEVKEEYPYLVKIDHEENNLSNILRAASFYGLSDDQIKRYNSELNLFFEKFSKYYNSVYENLSYLNDCIKIKLLLKNEGTAPAEDIDLQLHFPDGFELHNIKKLPKVLKQPEPPYKPKHRFDFQNTSNFFPSFPHVNTVPEVNVDLSVAQIKKTNSYDVDFHLRSLKHNQTYEFETLYLKYENRDLAENFRIDYKIMIANYPNIINNKLNVVVK